LPEKEAFYRQLLAEAAKGEPMTRVARRHGVHHTSLFHWRRTIEKRDAEAKVSIPAPASLLPVELAPLPGPVVAALTIGGTPHAAEFVVRTRSGHEVRVARGFNADELRTLVAVLEGSTCS
jgi:hypothetical protein